MGLPIKATTYKPLITTTVSVGLAVSDRMSPIVHSPYWNNVCSIYTMFNNKYNKVVVIVVVEVLVIAVVPITTRRA